MAINWNDTAFSPLTGSMISYGDAIRDMYAVVAGLVSGAGSGVETFVDPTSLARLRSYNDEYGNRTRIVRA